MADCLRQSVAVSCRFLTADSEGWFRFAAEKGEAFTVGCQPFPADSAAVPVRVRDK